MNIKSTFVVYFKELKDILRDRRTVLSMILFPIILMPLLTIGMMKFMQSRIEKIREQRSTVAWISQEKPDILLSKVDSVEGIDVLPGLKDTLMAFNMLREKDIDAVVVIPDGFYQALDSFISRDSEAQPPDIGLYSDDTREKSRSTSRKVTNIIVQHRTELVTDDLVKHGFPAGYIKPFFVMIQNIASAEQMGRFLAGSFLPYIVILMAMTGAMYPAIDLTAGEKERGTLETLLVSGVSRLDIVMGKFFTVFTASVITSALAVGSMAFAGVYLIGMAPEKAAQLNFSIEPIGVVLMIIAMIPLGAIFSSLLMTLSLFAKSYREAQSYISPLMIIVIIPAMASVMPDTELSKELALVPVLNVSMMMKEALMGTVDPGTIAVTMAVNFILAAAGLFLVLKMFQRESVLFRM
ncbi:MAG: ABC transporter permease [Candidatus Hatepunaea meridiana]|nr:ABC transporter permease [Candidatus Hatepunaea meridiana]